MSCSLSLYVIVSDSLGTHLQMTYRVFCIIIIACLAQHAYGMESDVSILVSAESLDHGTVSTIGVGAGSDIFYGGLSLSRIASSRVIQYDNRKTIHPIYFFVGLKAPVKFSPYIEAGIDLPEAIIDDLLDNEKKSEAQADYYYSGGLVAGFTDKISISLYARNYYFIYRENIYAPTIKTRPHSYGVRLSIRF